MKKQLKKLSLSKRTISNLSSSEMSNKFGGSTGCTYTCRCGGTGGNTKQCTQNGNNCPSHKTC